MGSSKKSPAPRRPQPEVGERAARRRFTAADKLQVLREADQCAGVGELGALLRREGLYSSHLTTWRRQREHGALVPSPRMVQGPLSRYHRKRGHRHQPGPHVRSSTVNACPRRLKVVDTLRNVKNSLTRIQWM